MQRVYVVVLFGRYASHVWVHLVDDRRCKLIAQVLADGLLVEACVEVFEEEQRERGKIFGGVGGGGPPA